MRRPVITFLKWGSELTWADTDIYQAKLLYIASGLSMPFPNIIQNLYVCDGNGTILISGVDELNPSNNIDYSLSISVGQIFSPVPYMNHVLLATTDMTVLYASVKI